MVKKLSLFVAGLLLLSICTFSHTSPHGKNLSIHIKKGININDLAGSTEFKNRTGKEIRPGDIILVYGSTWIDQVIKKIIRSDYTHVAGVVKSNEVIDILPFTQAGYKNLRLFAGKADVFTCDTLTDDQRRKIVDYVNRKVGTSYNYWLVVWEGCRYLLNWQWPYKTGKSGLCSTLWADAYREAGVDLCPEAIFPSPRDLADSRLLRKVCGLK